MQSKFFEVTLCCLTAIAISFSYAASAADQSEPALDHCEWQLQERFDLHVEKMLQHFEGNLSVRGLDNNHYPPTQENRDLAKKYGFLWWYTQGYFVKDEAAALAHAKQFAGNIQDQFSVGLYFFAEESELGIQPTEKGALVPAENLRRLLAKGALEIDYLDTNGKLLETPRLRKISGDELLKRITVDNQSESFGVTYALGHPRSFHSNYINLNAWHTGKFRGLVDHAEVLNSSSANREIDLYQNLYGQGYRVVFRPSDVSVQDDAFDVLLNTVRKKRMIVDGKKVDVSLPVAINRHQSVGVAYLRTPDSYISVTINPQGQVVGGSAGAIKNMEGETVFYSEARQGNLPELQTSAELACTYVMMMSLKQGIRYSSSGPMVTNYSESIGAKVYPLRQALAILAQNTQDTSQIVNDSVWDPFVGNEAATGRLEKQFADLAKLKTGGGVTYARFLAAKPPVNATTAELAAKQGIEPGQLFIQVVSELSAAKDYAASHPERVGNTIFFLYPKWNSLEAKSGSALKALEALVAKGLPTLAQQKTKDVVDENGIQMVFSFKKPQSLEMRFYEKSTLVPRLNLPKVPTTSWQKDPEGNDVIAIEGWVAPVAAP